MSIYQWQVHRCPGIGGNFLAGPHFHLLNGPEIPSWPFWSLETGVKLVDFCLDYWVPPEHPDREKEELQAARAKAELCNLAKTQRRSANGHFDSGFILPRHRSRFDRGEVAKEWANFFRNESSSVLVYEDLLVRHIPLAGCDFINRPNENEILARGLRILENSIASPRTIPQVGIKMIKLQ